MLHVRFTINYNLLYLLRAKKKLDKHRRVKLLIFKSKILFWDADISILFHKLRNYSRGKIIINYPFSSSNVKKKSISEIHDIDRTLYNVRNYCNDTIRIK